jgi:hypothetical protein
VVFWNVGWISPSSSCTNERTIATHKDIKEPTICLNLFLVYFSTIRKCTKKGPKLLTMLTAWPFFLAGRLIISTVVLFVLIIRASFLRSGGLVLTAQEIGWIGET